MARRSPMQDWFEELGASACAFWREDAGQDLIEYSLLVAFVALASVSMFVGSSRNGKGIWSTSNSRLSASAATATT